MDRKDGRPGHQELPCDAGICGNVRVGLARVQVFVTPLERSRVLFSIGRYLDGDGLVTAVPAQVPSCQSWQKFVADCRRLDWLYGLKEVQWRVDGEWVEVLVVVEVADSVDNFMSHKDYLKYRGWVPKTPTVYIFNGRLARENQRKRDKRSNRRR